MPSLQLPAPSWGIPRFSLDAGKTRVVFDLPSEVTYSLTPIGNRLRVDVHGASLPLPSVISLGRSGLRYTVEATGVVISTPFFLGRQEGWRAQEARIASGQRVLILDFGATLWGGMATQVPTTVLGGATSWLPPVMPPAVPLEDGRQANVVSDLQPTPTFPAPLLPGIPGERPSGLSGTLGTQPGPAPLGHPRVGLSPGMTRLVLDVPAQTTYRIVPGSTGLTIEFSGPGGVGTSGPNLSPEVRSWAWQSTSRGNLLNIQTVRPVREAGGWRGLVLPARAGQPARLVLDISPALANTAALGPAQKVLAMVPPARQASPRGLALLLPTFERPTIILDPGHGGIDPGAVGLVIEKVVALDVALRVRHLLSGAGVNVVMTRDQDTQLSLDKATDLKMRSDLAQGKQLFVSIHANATPPATVLRGYGVETWWNANHPGSVKLAQYIQREIITQTSAFDRGLKNNQTLGVLRRNPVPAVLVEMGFTSHPVDGLNLRDTNYLDRVALGVWTNIVSSVLDIFPLRLCWTGNF